MWTERRVAILAGCVVAITACGLTAFMPVGPLLGTFHDDAFYYYQVARNLGHGHGFTFDGLHPTNGFHPLWLFLVAPILRALPGDVAPLRAIVVLQGVLCAVAATVLVRVLAPRVGRAAAFAGAMLLVALPGAQTILCGGMETALWLCALVFLWRAWTRLPPVGELALRPYAALGAWTSIAFLARIETALMVPVMILLAPKRWLRAPRSLAAFLAIPAMTMAAYFVWNRLEFGAFTPISGAVKTTPWVEAQLGSSTTFFERLLFSAWPVRRLVWYALGRWLSMSATDGVYVALVVVCFVLCVVFRRRVRDAITSSGVGLLVAVCATASVAEAALLHVTGQWHGLWFILGVAALAAAFLARSARAARLIALALLLVNVFRAGLHVVWAARGAGAWEARIVDAAHWAREHIPENEPIGSWNAGIFAFFSHRHVVNLDGLANDREFYRKVFEERDLAGYLREEKIHWLADQILVPSGFDRPVDGLTVADARDLPLERVIAFCETNAPDCGGFAIWRILRFTPAP